MTTTSYVWATLSVVNQLAWGRWPGFRAAGAFAQQRRSAVLLQATATVVGVFLSLLAVVIYLALAIFYVIDPIRLMRHRSRRRSAEKVSAGG